MSIPSLDPLQAFYPGTTHGSEPGRAGEPVEPRAIRVARRLAWVAVLGALICGVALLARIVADQVPLKDPVGDSILYALIGLGLITPALIPWAAIRATGRRPRPGGRAVFWTLGPAAFAGFVALRQGLTYTLVDDLHDDKGGFVALLLAAQVGIVLYLVSLATVAILFAMPAARRHLARFRRPERAGRGRKLFTAATVLLALAAGFVPAAFVLLALAPTTDVVSWASPGRVATDFGRAVVTAGIALFVEVVAFGLTLTARITRRWAFRTAAYLAAVAGIGTLAAALGYGNIAAATASDYAGTQAQVYVWIGFVACVFAMLFHLIAVLMLAMPSVSTWIDTRHPLTFTA